MSPSKASQSPLRPDYFAETNDDGLRVLMRIKGSYRRYFVACAIRDTGLDSVPELWRQESLTEMFKQVLGSRNPSYRGGEDLPDLDPGEVEIARVQLLNSVHGEVTSLRARRQARRIALRVVDEYETEFDLPSTTISKPFTAEELLESLAQCDPSPLESSCKIGVSSWFYPDIETLAAKTLAQD